MLRGASERLDYNARPHPLRHRRLSRPQPRRAHLFNAQGELAARRDGRLTLLSNALDAPDAQDPQGLTRAQFERDPRQASAGALLFDTRKSVSQQQLGVVYARAARRAQLRLLGYAGDRDVSQFLSIPVATQRNPLSPGGVIDLRAPYAGIDARWTHAATLARRPLEFVVGLNFDRQRQHRRGYENFVGTHSSACAAHCGCSRTTACRRSTSTRRRRGGRRTAWSLMAGVRRSDVRFVSRDRYITAANPDDSGRARYRATSPVFGINWRAAPALAPVCRARPWLRDADLQRTGLSRRRRQRPQLRPARGAHAQRRGRAEVRRCETACAAEFALFRADTATSSP